MSQHLESHAILPRNGATLASLQIEIKYGLATGLQRRIFTDFYFGGGRLVEIFEDRNTSDFVKCNLIGDKKLTGNILKVIPRALVTDITTEEIYQFADNCLDREPEKESSSFLNFLGNAFRSLVIFPGTKWCGGGNIAKNYNDLRKESNTDRCCRAHDHSLDTIPALGKKHGIRNTKLYTMTACSDDMKLYNCLRNVGSSTSATIGTLYFNVLKIKCFDYTYPKKCTDYN
ncbi:phospholipase A2 imperatoxin-1-like [Amblyomma americanum]